MTHFGNVCKLCYNVLISYVQLMRKLLTIQLKNGQKISIFLSKGKADAFQMWKNTCLHSQEHQIQTMIKYHIFTYHYIFGKDEKIDLWLFRSLSLFVMTPTYLRRTGQLFCRMSFGVGLSDVFFVITLGFHSILI